MSRYHLTSTSRALYRVFVLPNLTPRLQPTTLLPPTSRSLPHLPITPIRTKIAGVVRNKPAPKRQAISDIFTFDNAIDDAIATNTISLINAKGDFIPNVQLHDAMRRYNRITHHLVLINPGEVDEFGEQDPEHPPICKIISKIDLRNQYNRKIEVLRKVEKGPSVKNLELNWAIAGGDLRHRMEKLRAFLKEGRKVELLLGPKRKGKKATDEEANAVLKAVEDVVAETKGAGEVKREGVLGGVMTVVFQGKKTKVDEAAQPSQQDGEEADQVQEQEAAKGG